MDGRRFNDQDDHSADNSPENSSDSPRSASTKMMMMNSITSPKRRRAIQKRVVSVPINEVEGSKHKGEISFPPSDSWAWRKYGQKPIKGSPYPRGYYRCSSSKGCPAKKQVERSRVDPTMLVVTYSCEHNHPWPAARHHHHHRSVVVVAEDSYVSTEVKVTLDKITVSRDKSVSKVEVSEDSEEDRDSPAPQPEPESNEDKFVDLGDSSSLMENDEFGWFSDFGPTPSTVIESSFLTEAKVTQADVSKMFSMREEDESLFGDLGELPECSREFGLRMMERDEARRRHNLTPWCGTA